VFDIPGSPRRFLEQDIQLHRRDYWKLVRQTRVASPRLLIHPTNYQAKRLGCDVEVGFPSTSAFVSEMRKAFWGSFDSSLEVVQHTRIELSSRQAHVGARVPFNLSISETCPVCGGRGELSFAPCGVCCGAGKGQVPHSVTLNLPAGVRHGSLLHFSFRLPYSSSTRIEALIEVRD
jgi:hypothetical protein